MKRKMIWISIAFMIVLVPFSLANYVQAKNPLSSINKYKIYYGEPNPDVIQKMKTMDMVIIEPHQYSIDQIKEIQAEGTIVLGYLSVMELEKWNEEVFVQVQENDYLKINGKKKYIPDWDTYLMDLSNSHYSSLLLSDTKKHIFDKELDGVFIDTVGDIDDYFHSNKKVKKKLQNGYKQLLKSIRKTSPETILVQNWGFETYKEVSKPYVNGILWENFSYKRLSKNEWGKKWISYFKKAEQKKKLKVFTVVPNDQSVRYSQKQKFIPLKNDSSIYNEW